MVNMQFKKAERKQAKLRLALCSPSGGGKTYSALKIAQGMGGRIAMLDTEHGSGSLYADNPGMPEYAILELSPPFSPQRYIEAMDAAEKAGYAILIIDSLSHAWAAEGGVLDMQETARLSSQSKNSWTAWREVTPKHNQLVEAILQSSCHIIATMRSKQEHAQVVEDGKTIIKKLGLAPVQREGMDYEFTLVLDLSMEHIATASKDRTSLFDGLHFKPTEETGQKLLAWLNQGKSQSSEPVKGSEKGNTPLAPPAANPTAFGVGVSATLPPEDDAQSRLSSGVRSQPKGATTASHGVQQGDAMPEVKNWGELAGAIANLGINTASVIQRGGYKRWQDFTDAYGSDGGYRKAWEIALALKAEKVKAAKAPALALIKEADADEPF